MTPQEQQMLQGLADRINQTQLTDKDPEAEQFIFEHLGKNSDSLYIMAQTILVQQYALDQAKAQLDSLKQQLQQAQQQPVKHTSFLGSLLGTDDPPQRSAPPPPPPQYMPVQPQYAQPQYGMPQYGAPQQGGGFLRSALQTATGVAAGALAFEGIESLMHGFGGHGGGYGMGGFGDSGFGGQPREEVINNNYYGDSAPGSEHDRGDLADRFQASGDQPSSDIEDRRDDSTQNDFAGSADDNASDSYSDDSSNDDSSGSDDGGGSFDDGGGSDFGGGDNS